MWVQYYDAYLAPASLGEGCLRGEGVVRMRVLGTGKGWWAIRGIFVTEERYLAVPNEQSSGSEGVRVHVKLL